MKEHGRSTVYCDNAYGKPISWECRKVQLWSGSYAQHDYAATVKFLEPRKRNKWMLRTDSENHLSIVVVDGVGHPHAWEVEQFDTWLNTVNVIQDFRRSPMDIPEYAELKKQKANLYDQWVMLRSECEIKANGASPWPTAVREFFQAESNEWSLQIDVVKHQLQDCLKTHGFII